MNKTCERCDRSKLYNHSGRTQKVCRKCINLSFNMGSRTIRKCIVCEKHKLITNFKRGENYSSKVCRDCMYQGQHRRKSKTLSRSAAIKIDDKLDSLRLKRELGEVWDQDI